MNIARLLAQPTHTYIWLELREPAATAAPGLPEGGRSLGRQAAFPATRMEAVRATGVITGNDVGDVVAAWRL